jgi:hypothetical protein
MPNSAKGTEDEEQREGVGIPVSNMKSGIISAVFQGIWRGKFFGGIGSKIFCQNAINQLIVQKTKLETRLG